MARPELKTRTADWTGDQQALRQIRHEVFVVEQNVPPDLEWDGEDEQCAHALALLDDVPVGTGRLSPDGKIGRMAVIATGRRRGVGGAILGELMNQARALGLKQVHLHAQTHALAFYERHGFSAHGDEFDEAGIPHRHMTRTLI
ncbi:MAG: GNAT family N-acetyltransferase [Gammaproteobacteria bacterium]